MDTGTTSMQGKTVLITGATSGIGQATATELARRGAHIIAVGRDPARGEAAVAQIRRASGNGRVNLLPADLASLAEIRRLAGEVERRHDRLDVLINNAGGMWPGRIETPDGYEMMFAVNHLAPFLLTHLLRPLLERSAPSRVVNVTSGAQAWARGIDFDDLQHRGHFSDTGVYAHAKLAQLTTTYEWARRLAGTGVTINAVEPGVVNTPNLNHMRGPVGAVTRLLRGLLSTPEQGARSSVYAASSPEVEGVSGRFFSSRLRPAHPNRVTSDEAAASRLWRVSEELTGLAQERAAPGRPALIGNGAV